MATQLLHLLPFAPIDDELVSKDVQPSLFVDKLSGVQGSSDDIQHLENLRGLDTLRRELICRQSPSLTAGMQPSQIEQLSGYIEQLHSFSKKPDLKDDAFQTSWNSPLSPKASYFYRLKGVTCELAMAVAFLAGGLQALGHAQLAPARSDPQALDDEVSAAQQQQPSDGGAACASASLLFRQAAGVWEWLAEFGAPPCEVVLPAGSRPCELTMDVAKAQVQVCCAQAQIVIAHRAEQRSSPPGLLSSLFAGAGELFELAAQKFKDCSCEVSENVRRHSALSAGVAQARALAWWGQHLQTVDLEAGKGEAACIQGASVLKQCEAAAQNDEWLSHIQQEQLVLEAFRHTCEKARVGVYYQSIAKACPDLPASKILAKPLPWVPGSRIQFGDGSKSVQQS